MDIVSIIARAASGYAVKLAAIGFAIYAVSEVWTYVHSVFSTVQGVL